MAKAEKTTRIDGCKGCNVMNAELIMPIHTMKEDDFKKLGINFWSSDFSDIFSNGT